MHKCARNFLDNVDNKSAICYDGKCPKKRPDEENQQTPHQVTTNKGIKDMRDTNIFIDEESRLEERIIRMDMALDELKAEIKRIQSEFFPDTYVRSVLDQLKVFDLG